MHRKLFIRLLAAALLCLTSANWAFPQTKPPAPIQVIVSPDKPDWNYQLGEQASFTVTVLKHQVPLAGVEVTWNIGPERMPTDNKGTSTLKTGTAVVGKGTLKEPGFLRCEARVTVDGEQYRGLATAGYAPEEIKVTQTLPDDFQAFWDKAKADAANIPLDARLTLLPDRCTEKANVYELNLQNYAIGARVYGILSVPKAPGKYPAVLEVPGAGIRPYNGDVALAEKGVITLQIGIHGIPVTYPPVLYDNLVAGALANYNSLNLNDRDNYYYKRVYLGCVRALDYLVSMPEYDGSNLAVMGGSQGGALSIVTASLDSRIKYLVCLYPALSDLTGYLHGRAGGWPHMFTGTSKIFAPKEDNIKTSAYYDVANFARFIKVPGFYSWGYNDETCPPTSIFAAYNLITAPKELFVMQETGHWTFPEQQTKIQAWLLNKLGK